MNHDNSPAHRKGEPQAASPGPMIVQASRSTPAGHAGGHDHATIISDFRRRFWLAPGFTPTVLFAAVFVSASPLIVAINAQLLRFYRSRR